MKYRLGFVTNSSSSSFICNICGYEVSGWDMTLWEAEMVECVNGHRFCEEEMIEKTAEEWVKFLENELNCYPSNPTDIWEMKMEYLREYEERYSVHEDFCPICQMQVLSDIDFMNYMSKKLNMDSRDALKEIKERFGTYTEFKKWIHSKG